MRCGGCCYSMLMAGVISFVFAVSIAQEPDSTAVDDDWLNTVWTQVDEMVKEEEYESQEIVTVAGVRGAEAEDNILDKLYYKGGKRYPNQSKLLKAIETLEKAIEKNPKGKDVPKQKYFIAQCYEKLGRTDESKKYYKNIVDNHKDSSYNNKAQMKLQ
jgi:tetratricopeptide (TPR) repeat protein